jgi:hypothetical protein
MVTALCLRQMKIQSTALWYFSGSFLAFHDESCDEAIYFIT